METFIMSLMMIVPVAFVCWMIIKSDIEKSRIMKDYSVMVWDEQDSLYVVEDKETKKQYILESTLSGYKFKDSDVDWSDCRGYRKERIPGTRRYE